MRVSGIKRNNVTIEGIVLGVGVVFVAGIRFSFIYLFDEPTRAVTKPNYLMRSKLHIGTFR